MRYEFRNEQGRVCCKSDDVKLLCEKCRRRVSGRREMSNAPSMTDTSTIPDGYAKPNVRRPPYSSSDPLDGYSIALAKRHEHAE